MRAFNFLREKDTGKISKKRIAIIAVVLLLAAAIITSPVAKIVRYNIPIESDNVALDERTLEYQGKTYYFYTAYAGAYDLEVDKKIWQKGLLFRINYFTLKDDENKDFIYVSQWRERYLYATRPVNEAYLSEHKRIKY